MSVSRLDDGQTATLGDRIESTPGFLSVRQVPQWCGLSGYGASVIGRGRTAGSLLARPDRDCRLWVVQIDRTAGRDSASESDGCGPREAGMRSSFYLDKTERLEGALIVGQLNPRLEFDPRYAQLLGPMLSLF